MENIVVRLIDMPCTIHGFTTTDSDGDYNVYINARLGYYMQEIAYRHEMNHIEAKHFYSSDKTLEMMEAEI